MAVNCAILSYDSTVCFGFSGDTHAAPDLRRLEKLLQESFVELRDTVGIQPPQGKKDFLTNRGFVIRQHRSPIPVEQPCFAKDSARVIEKRPSDPEIRCNNKVESLDGKARTVPTTSSQSQARYQRP